MIVYPTSALFSHSFFVFSWVCIYFYLFIYRLHCSFPWSNEIVKKAEETKRWCTEQHKHNIKMVTLTSDHYASGNLVCLFVCLFDSSIKIQSFMIKRYALHTSTPTPLIDCLSLRLQTNEATKYTPSHLVDEQLHTSSVRCLSPFSSSLIFPSCRASPPAHHPQWYLSSHSCLSPEWIRMIHARVWR